MNRRTLIQSAAFLPLVVRAAAPQPQMITPEQFGAVGDGATDDTAALQAALDAGARGALIQLAPATYRTTAPLSIHQEQTVRGTGHFSVIEYAGTDCALRFDSQHGGRLSDLMLRGTAGTALRFDSAYNWTLDNVSIAGFEIGAAFVNTSANNLLTACQLRQCGIGVQAQTVTNTLRDGCCIGCTIGVQTTGGSGAIVVDGMGFALGDWHIDLAAPGQGVVIRDCWMENSQQGNIRIGTGAFGPFGAVVTGCVLHTYGAANVALNGGAVRARLTDNWLSGPRRVTIAATHPGARLRDNIAFHATAGVIVEDASGFARID